MNANAKCQFTEFLESNQTYSERISKKRRALVQESSRIEIDQNTDLLLLGCHIMWLLGFNPLNNNDITGADIAVENVLLASILMSYRAY
jgi:hypothetical protein